MTRDRGRARPVPGRPDPRGRIFAAGAGAVRREGSARFQRIETQPASNRNPGWFESRRSLARNRNSARFEPNTRIRRTLDSNTQPQAIRTQRGSNKRTERSNRSSIRFILLGNTNPTRFKLNARLELLDAEREREQRIETQPVSNRCITLLDKAKPRLPVGAARLKALGLGTVPGLDVVPGLAHAVG